MNIERKIYNAIKYTGQHISLEKDGITHSFIAQIQPIHDKSKLYLESNYSSLGKIDRSHALYFGPIDSGGEFVLEGQIISVASTSYIVKISEPFFFKDKAAYIWAILQRSYGESEGI